MLMPNTAAYGSWKSPIISNLVAQSITLSEARFDGEDIYWLEGRPQESGRLVVVRANALDGHATDVTPKPYNARTRVHEYGGASWTVANGDVYFSNFAGGRLYRQTNNSSHPVPLTPAPAVPEHQSCCSSPSVGRGPNSRMSGFRRRVGIVVKQRYMVWVMCGRSTYKLTWE